MEPYSITIEAFVVKEHPHSTQALSPLCVVWGCSLTITGSSSIKLHDHVKVSLTPFFSPQNALKYCI